MAPEANVVYFQSSFYQIGKYASSLSERNDYPS